MTVSAIVLAAGESKRFGADNKLLAMFVGVPLVRRVVSNCLNSKVDDVIVVTGHQREEVSLALIGLDCQIVFNSEFRSGMGTSLSRGVQASPLRSEIMVIAADMVNFGSAYIDEMLNLLNGHDSVVVCQSGSYRGQPVIFGHGFRSELLELHGQEGARSVLNQAHKISYYEVPEDALFDIDTLEDLQSALNN